MPFGLKNDGATYQRLVDKAFDSQVGRNMEVYVDDLVIKSHTEAEMIRDINETFRTSSVLHDPVPTFNQRGPEPSNGKAVPLKRVTSLDSRSGNKLIKQLKPALVAELPCWVDQNQRGTDCLPGGFMGVLAHGPELNYSPMEKLVLSLVFAAKRLRRYFQAHPIAVITDQPIKQIMSRLGRVAGRFQKMERMLGEHNITYRPMTSVKGQILGIPRRETGAENT
ncbi:reverse transcriptase domain-containing protein [Tanacetum coccineum]